MHLRSCVQTELVVHLSVRPSAPLFARSQRAYCDGNRSQNPLINHLILPCVNLDRFRFFKRYSTVGVSGLSSSSELVDWVNTNGGSVHDVAIHSWQGVDGGSGYGLKANRDVKAGEELVVLPGNLQIRYQEGRDPSSLKKMMDTIPEELWGAKLALKLLYERLQGEEGHFWHYIENLPVGFPGLPLFFDQKTIQALEYPPVSSQVIKRCRWLLQFAKEELQKKTDNPFHGTEIDANALGWAFAAVTTRAFRPGGPKSPGVLLPLIDMCNHSFNPNAKVIGSKAGTASDCLSMVAVRDITADEPIMLCYGNLPNDFLLLDYGFVIEDNPFYTVKLSFDAGFVEGAKAVANVGSLIDDGSDTVKLIPWQQKLLEDLCLHIDKEVSIVRSGKDGSPVDDRLLAGVRILCATKESDCKSHELGNWNEDIQNISWELSSMKTLMGMCIIALSQFSTSSAQDVSLIEEHDGDYGLAVTLRKEKKAILSNAVERIKERIEKIRDGDISASKKKKSKQKSPSPNKGFGRNK